MNIMDAAEKEAKAKGTGVLDIITEKAISRKLLVWIVATVLLACNKITPDEWTAVSLGYVGVEGFADLAMKWRGAKK